MDCTVCTLCLVSTTLELVRYYICECINNAHDCIVITMLKLHVALYEIANNGLKITNFHINQQSLSNLHYVGYLAIKLGHRYQVYVASKNRFIANATYL